MENKKASSILVPVFYSILMVVMVYLFVLAGNLRSVTAWVYAAFLMGIFCNLIIGKKISFFRRIYLVTFSLLFAVSYITHLVEAFGGMALSEAAVLTHTIPFNQFLIPVLPFFLAFGRTVQFPSSMAGGVLSVFGLVLVWLMASLTIGKAWCGWICPFGGYEDFFSRVLKRPVLDVSRFAKKIRRINFTFLGIIVLFSVVFLMPVYVYWLNPFNIITGYFTSGGVHGVFVVLITVLLFVSLVVILPLLTRKRFQCSAYCPLGALNTLCNGASSFRVVIDPLACNNCMKCVEACSFCAIDQPDAGGELPAIPILTKACAYCGECVDMCPQNAIRYEYSFVKNQSDVPKGKSVLGKILLNLLAPAHMFLFIAFTFCVFFSSHFALDALDFIVSFVRSIL